MCKTHSTKPSSKPQSSHQKAALCPPGFSVFPGLILCSVWCCRCWRVWRKAFSIPCLPSHLLDSYFLLFQPTTAVVTAGNLISAEIMANFMWERWRELFYSELIKCVFHGTAQYPGQWEATFLSPANPPADAQGVGLFLLPEGRNRSINPISHPGNAMGRCNSSLST